MARLNPRVAALGLLLAAFVLSLFTAAASAAAPSTRAAVSVRWRYDAGKPLHSAPASDGKRLFLADSEGTVTALDLATRQKLWTNKGAADISASLLVVNSEVIAADEDGVVRAMDTATGKELWRFTAAGKIVSRPTAAGKVIYTGSYDEHLYALDAETGTLVWKFKTAAQVHASPALSDGRVLIAGCDGQLRAVDAKSGQQLWATEIGDPIATSPRVKDGVAFIGTLKGELLAVEIMSGQVRWRTAGRETRQDQILASASIEGDRVSFVTQSGVQVSHNQSDGQWRATAVYRGRLSSDGVDYAGAVWYASEEGKLFRSSTLAQPAFTAGGGIKAAPVVIGDDLLVADESGMLWALRAK